MLYKFLTNISLKDIALTIVTLGSYPIIRAVFSWISRPAVWFDSEKNQSLTKYKAYTQNTKSQDYNVIFLGSNCYRHESMELLSKNEKPLPNKLNREIEGAVQTIYPDYIRSEHGATFFQPAYHHDANRCIHELVEYVEKTKDTYQKTILVGTSLGGGFTAIAAEKLKARGTDVDLVNIRSFESIGAIVTDRIGFNPNVGFGSHFVKPLLNFTLNFFGGWDLNAYKAIDNIEKMNKDIDKEVGGNRSVTKIFIAGYENDSKFGEASLHKKYKLDGGNNIQVFRQKSPYWDDDNHNKPLKFPKKP